MRGVSRVCLVIITETNISILRHVQYSSFAWRVTSLFPHPVNKVENLKLRYLHVDKSQILLRHLRRQLSLKTAINKNFYQ